METKEKYVKPIVEIIVLEAMEGIMSTSPGGHNENLNGAPTDNSEGGIEAYSRRKGFWD